MKAKLFTIDNKSSGELTLNEAIFGLEVRKDILNRVVRWQLARRQAGTHKVKNISEISGTTAKPFKQKGTGNARQGSRRAAQMRGGATTFGPQVRSHAHSLPKKIRKLGLKTALSAKLAEGSLIFIKDVDIKNPKTSALAKDIANFDYKSILVIDKNDVDKNFALSLSNIKALNILPTEGANVYDILKHNKVIITETALKELEERLA